MTVTLELKPEVEAGLLTQAQENSLAEERAAAYEVWSAGHRPTPLLSDYAVSREAMYEGRDD